MEQEQSTTEVPEIQEEVPEVPEIQEQQPIQNLEEISLHEIQEQMSLEEIKATPYLSDCSPNSARILTLTGLWMGLCIAAAFI